MTRHQKIVLFKSLAIIIGLLSRLPKFDTTKFLEEELIPLVGRLEAEELGK